MNFIKVTRLAEMLNVTGQTLKNHLKRLNIKPLRSSPIRGNILLTKQQAEQVLTYVFGDKIPNLHFLSEIKNLEESTNKEPIIKTNNNKKKIKK